MFHWYSRTPRDIIVRKKSTLKSEYKVTTVEWRTSAWLECCIFTDLTLHMTGERSRECLSWPEGHTLIQFLGLNCSKISNELERKYLMKPYLALWQKNFRSQSIDNRVLKSKKSLFDISATLPPIWVSRIIWMTPYGTSEDVIMCLFLE